MGDDLPATPGGNVTIAPGAPSRECVIFPGGNNLTGKWRADGGAPPPGRFQGDPRGIAREKRPARTVAAVFGKFIYSGKSASRRPWFMF